MIYNNLSQMTDGRLVYFRSTDVEQKNYHRLLWSVPDEWFYLLLKGGKIIIRDKSSNKGKIANIFIPTLNDVMNFLFFSDEPRNRRTIQHFYIALEALMDDRSLYRKFRFWKGKIHKRINIVSKTIRVEKEPNPLATVDESKI